MNPELIAKLVSLVASGVQLMAQLHEASKLVQTLQTENREPTQAEWDAIDQGFAQARQALDAAITARG